VHHDDHFDAGGDNASIDVTDEQPPVDDGSSDVAEVADALDVVDVRTRDVPSLDAPSGHWRSVLFADTWRPVHAGGSADAMGRFVHDFSTAGYHRGDEAPPYGEGTIVHTVDGMFGDGVRDATAAIQTAIDGACASAIGGLRVVRIPAGTYVLRFASPSPAADPALRIACSNLVVRGDGASRTRLVLDDPSQARDRAMLRVASRSYNVWSGGAALALGADALSPTRTLTLTSTAGLAVGALVSVRTDLSDAFRAEHRMNMTLDAQALWPATTSRGLLYPRRVVAIDADARTVTLDAPTRYAMRVRDNARVVQPGGYLHEVGLEDFAFGMREHATSASGMPGPLGDRADDAYTTPGTAAYEVDASEAIRFDAVHDAWIYRVESFQPSQNLSGAHILSTALRLTEGVHRVTVERCRFERPQYRGGGGNGYLFWVSGEDNLIVDSEGVAGRHNLIASSIACSGNVWLRARSTQGRLADDSHQGLSHANLYDTITLDSAWLQGVNRGATSTGAGFTASETVYWNIRSMAAHPTTHRVSDGFATGFAVETAQFGWGYVVGTSGAAPIVATRTVTNRTWAALDQGAPVDYVEGVGRGETLFPSSLYEEQRRRRWLRDE
jgi:hypothetical protein